MDILKPSPYSNTDSAEQDAVNTFNSLINTRYVKADVHTRDKYPNVDGIIELVDENQLPYGKFEIQIRTLPAGQMNYSCPVTLVAYSIVSTLPIILICVDPSSKVAFWRKISATMPEFREGQKTFTIHFDEIADGIRADGIYLQKWTEIVLDYRERISGYPLLQKEIAEKLRLEGISPDDRVIFQRYIETINNLLDNEFPVIKELMLSDVWKLGVGLFSSDEKSVAYQLYTIPYGEPYPLVCKLTGGSLISKQPNRYALSDHQTARTYFQDPEAVGQKYVIDHLVYIVQKKALPVRSLLASIDILFAFVDVYHIYIGLTPNQNSYTISELSFALNQHLLGVCAALALQITKSKNSTFVHLDLDLIRHLQNPQGIKPIYPADSPVRFSVSSSIVSVKSAFDALQYLLSCGIDAITRPFVPRNRLLTPGNNWVWSGYSVEDEIQNVTLILGKSIEEYQAFVQGNRLKFAGSPYLDPNVAIVYEYQRSKPSGDWLSGPTVSEHHIENSAHTLPKVSIYLCENEREKIVIGQFPNLQIQGRDYRAILSSRSDASFLFQGIPVVRMLYRMLSDDLSRNYNIGRFSVDL